MFNLRDALAFEQHNKEGYYSHGDYCCPDTPCEVNDISWTKLDSGYVVNESMTLTFLAQAW